MAVKKFSAFTAGAAAADSDELVGLQAADNARWTFLQLWNYITGKDQGTAFPTTPATGRRFFRTDRGIEYFYDGTRWLSTQLFIIGAAAPGDNAASVVMGFNNPHGTAYDIWAEKVSYSARMVVTGTFTFTLSSFNGTSTTVLDNGTTTTAAAALNELIRTEAAINAVVASTADGFQFNADRTSGTARGPSCSLCYRLIG